MRKEIKELYISYLEDRINDFDYSEVDGFFEDNEVTDEEMNELLNMNFKVIENKNENN